MNLSDTAKTVIAVVTAGLVALGAVVSDGVTIEEGIAVVLAMLAALGGGTAYAEHRKAERAQAEVVEMRRKSLD